jgi:capsular polysaccharide biosynthesis protein
MQDLVRSMISRSAPRSIAALPDAISSAEFAAAGGGRWLIAFPPRERDPVRPAYFGEQPADFDRMLERQVPAIGVIESGQLAVAGANGLLITFDGRLLLDHSWFHGQLDRVEIPRRRFRTRALRGRVLTLASDWSCFSYGHFIQDSLPRIAILKHLGIDPGAFDHVICGAPSSSALGLLAAAGIRADRVIPPPSADEAIVAETIVAPTFPGCARGMEPWAGTFFRETYRFADKGPARRLYVARRNRKPTNEDVPVRMARDLGFDIYHPEDDQQNQARVFAEAEAIVGAAGSALANIAFCKAGTKLLELVPTDHVFPYYCTMASAVGVHYAHILCPSITERADHSIGPGTSDFVVDERAFADALDWLASDTAAVIPASRQPKRLPQ